MLDHDAFQIRQQGLYRIFQSLFRSEVQCFDLPGRWIIFQFFRQIRYLFFTRQDTWPLRTMTKQLNCILSDIPTEKWNKAWWTTFWKYTHWIPRMSENKSPFRKMNAEGGFALYVNFKQFLKISWRRLPTYRVRGFLQPWDPHAKRMAYPMSCR